MWKCEVPEETNDGETGKDRTKRNEGIKGVGGNEIDNDKVDVIRSNRGAEIMSTRGMGASLVPFKGLEKRSVDVVDADFLSRHGMAPQVARTVPRGTVGDLLPYLSDPTYRTL